MSKIFVSHAALDAILARDLVDLMRLGIGVSGSESFFSSAPGSIPNGEFFVQRILTELNASDLIICIVSRAYLKSQFCLAEVGAAQVRRMNGTGDLYTLLVPPTSFTELSAVLYGTQSGDILNSKCLDELHDRIVHKLERRAHTATWNEQRDKFMDKAKKWVERTLARDLVERLTTQDLFFERAERDDITYKLKLRVYIRNETGFNIHVTKPAWIASPDEVQVRPTLTSSVQVEGGGGWHNDEWQGESEQADVGQGQTFRIWVGLNWAVNDNELRRRHENLRVGTVCIPIRINGIAIDFTKKI
jgi:hypothetical protein